MLLVTLYPFRYRDRLTGKWVKARYVATTEEMARRYAEYEITGPPEVREVDADEQSFNPWRTPAPVLPRFRYPLLEAS